MEQLVKYKTRTSFFTQMALIMLTLAWVVRVTIFIRGRSPTKFASIDVTAGIQIAMVFATLAILLLTKRSFEVLTKLRGTSAKQIVFYYFICIASTAWSVLPQYTGYRSLEFLTMFLAALVALSYSTTFFKAEKLFCVVSLIVVVLSMFVNIKYYGFTLSLRGWHTNSYSASAAILSVYCFGEMFKARGGRRRMLLLFALFGLAAVAIGTSAASNISMLVGICIIALLMRNIMLLTTGVFVLIIIAALMVIYGGDSSSILMSTLFPGKTEEEIVTMHGRTGMWEMLFDHYLRKPLAGYGFGVISSTKGNLFANDPHNSLFSIILGTGVIGLIAAASYAVRFIGEARVTLSRKMRGAIGGTAAIVTGLINSLSMPLIFSKWEESSLVFSLITALFVLFVLLPYREERAQLRRERAMAQRGY